MYWAQLTLDAGLTGKCCKNAIFILSPWNSQKVETVDLPLGRVGFMIENRDIPTEIGRLHMYGTGSL
mgnify:CR=1 FL=1